MRPKDFTPETLNDDERFARDKASGLIYHRVFTRPLYADTDRSQVVYHSNYLRYFELGRATLMRDIGYPYKEVEESGYVYPIVELGVNYYKPLYYDEPIWVYTRPAEIDRVRVRFEYAISHAERGYLIAKGFTLHAALNPSGKVIAVDPKTQEMWRAFPK